MISFYLPVNLWDVNKLWGSQLLSFFMSEPDLEKLSANAILATGQVNSRTHSHLLYYPMMGSGSLMHSSLYPLWETLALTSPHLKTNVRPSGQPKSPTLLSTGSKPSKINLFSFVGNAQNILPKCTHITHWSVSEFATHWLLLLLVWKYQTLALSVTGMILL